MSSAHSRCSIFVPLLALFLVAINPTSADAQPSTQELIDKVCRQMEEYGFCNQVFQENLISEPSDYSVMTQITIDQCIQNATDTHNFVVRLLQNTTEEPLRTALRVCEHAYAVVLESFQDAQNSYNNKDYDAMLITERKTPRAQGSCDVIFQTPPSPVDPLVDRNRQMRILIAMAIVTGHELLPGD